MGLKPTATKILLLTITLLAALLPAASATAAPERPAWAPGELIVKFTPSSAPTGRLQALSQAGAGAGEAIGTPRTRLVELDPGTGGVPGAIGQLEARPEVAWAEPNYLVRATAAPDDPFYRDGSLWGLRNGGQTVPQFLLPPGGPPEMENRAGTAGNDIDAEPAWDLSTGSREVLIGVIDSGIARHEDLDANLRLDLSRDFSQIDSEGDATADSVGHGTHVAGTIGAVGDNGIGVTGVNWETGLVGIRALSSMSGTAASIASAVAYAGQLGLPVANMSVGLPAYSQALADAVRLAPGTLFVVAAGNNGLDNDGRDFLPCTLPYENLLCVAATGNVGDIAFFSNYGEETVDLGAPGNGINSTWPSFEDVEYFDPEDFGQWQTGPNGQEWLQGTTPGEEDEIWSKQPGDTQAAVDSFVQPPTIPSLAGRKGCTVTGQYQLDLNPPGDEQPRGVLVVERSIGGIQWREIGVTNQSSGENWVDFKHSLHADGRENVMVRFRLVVPDGVEAGLNGARLYDLRVECQEPGTSSAYKVENGTSMASPAVAGAAGLMLAHNPDLDTAELKQALISTVSPLNSLAGRTATGGVLNLAAAMREVTPPEPPPPPPPPPPEPPVVKPNPRVALWPGRQLLRAYRGVAFRVTSDHRTAVTARAVIRWRRSPAEQVRVRQGQNGQRPMGPGQMRLLALRGGDPAPWNFRARIAEPGRISGLRLVAHPRQLIRLVRLARRGYRLRATLSVRFYSPELDRAVIRRRSFPLPVATTTARSRRHQQPAGVPPG